MYNEKVPEMTSTFEGIMDNLDSFEDAGIPSSSVATVVIVDGVRPFLTTYNKSESVRSYLGPLFSREKIAQRFNVDHMFTYDSLNEAIIDEIVAQQVLRTDEKN
jgi:hypothetical protein